jgi:hypothetical protein
MFYKPLVQLSRKNNLVQEMTVLTYILEVPCWYTDRGPRN